MACSNLSSPFPSYNKCRNLSKKQFLSNTSRYLEVPFSSRVFSSSAIVRASSAAMEKAETEAAAMKLLFVEMGVGYDQHGQVLCPWPCFFSYNSAKKNKKKRKSKKVRLFLSQARHYCRSNAGMQGCDFFQFDSGFSERYASWIWGFGFRFYLFGSFIWIWVLGANLGFGLCWVL